MLYIPKVVLSLGLVIGVIATVWLVQPKHLRELDKKGPAQDLSVWECVGSYCIGPDL